MGSAWDAVKYIYEDEPTEISGEFWENDPDTLHFFTEVRDILDRYGEAPHGKHKMMVAENWETNPSKIKAYGRHEGEPAFHSTLDFYSAYNMRNAVISANPNYVTGISGTTGFYNYASTFNTIPDIDLAPFLSNHDNVVDRPATYSNSTAKSRLAASLLLFSPGSPYLYYGNEIAMTGAAGDDRELRTPMDWGEVASQSLDDSSVLSWYQALGKARGEYATVFSNPGKIRETFTGSGWSAVLWQDGATELLAVFNLEGSTKSVTLDLSSYSLSASAVSNVIGSSDGNFSNLASFQVNDIPLYGTRLLNLNDGGAQNYALDNTTDVSTYVPPNHPNLYIRGDSIPGATWGMVYP
jgi:glycosidase